MDKDIIKFIEHSLTSLDKATTWIFLTLMAILLSGNNSEEYEFGGIKIKKGHSALVFYMVLCALNFQVLKLMQLLSSNFSAVKDRAVAIQTIQNDTWLFNPFTRTNSFIGNVTDNLGLPLLILMWWLGFALANREISHLRGRKKNSVLILVLFFVYLFEGLLSLIVLEDLLIRIGGNVDKMIWQFGGVAMGITLFFMMDKKSKFLNAIFNG